MPQLGGGHCPRPALRSQPEPTSRFSASSSPLAPRAETTLHTAYLDTYFATILMLHRAIRVLGSHQSQRTGLLPACYCICTCMQHCVGTYSCFICDTTFAARWRPLAQKGGWVFVPPLPPVLSMSTYTMCTARTDGASSQIASRFMPAKGRLLAIDNCATVPCPDSLSTWQFLSRLTNQMYQRPHLGTLPNTTCSKLSSEQTAAMSHATRSFDFVIVGGGTSGLVLASRLSENPAWKILVIESGEDQTEDARVSVPGLWPTLLPTSSNWAFETVAQVCSVPLS